MGEKKNCWEVMLCGREPGGGKTGEFGVCIASVEDKLDGVHGGKNGGRACWVLKNTLCGGDVQSNFAVKLGRCVYCEFYKMVGEEEQTVSTMELRGMLK